MSNARGPAWSPPAGLPPATHPDRSTFSPASLALPIRHMEPDAATGSGLVRQSIDSVAMRRQARVGGLIVDSWCGRWAGGDVFECVLDDGTGQVGLAFLGRREVPGVGVGALLSANGVVGLHRGRRILLNPEIIFWTRDD